LDLLDFYKLIIRNFLIIGLTTVMGAGGAFLITERQTPMYSATVQLFISTPATDGDLGTLIQGSGFSAQRVKSYAQIINGPQTLLPVISQLKLNTSYSLLASRVKASAPLDTVLLNVSVMDESGTRAASIANAIGKQFSITANELEVESSTSSETIKVTMVKTATIPTSPSSPRPLVNIILGILIGLGLGLTIGLIRQVIDSTIKNEDDLDETPLLAAVGFDKSASKFPLVTQISRYAPRTEAFRHLRTNIQYSQDGKAPRVIAITSAVPNEGKTSSSINLAISLTNAGLRTCFIEADLRKPKTSKYLELDREGLGLADYLKDAQAGKPVIEKYLQSWGEQGLQIMSAGEIPENPAELLEGAGFSNLINTLRERFDYVILDTPPALPVADAAIIASRTDGVIIIIKAGETKINQFKGVCDSIQSVGSRVIGSVINMIPTSRSYDNYGYRYGYGYSGSYRYSRKYKPYESIYIDETSTESNKHTK
jgi:polysaccharide biosynthesis transport protein